MKHSKHHDDIALDRKVDGVRETLYKCAADSRSKFLIFQRTVDDPAVSSAEFVEELQP